MENGKRLYRSNTVKVIGGVCGGLADYLHFDVALIRVAFVLLVLFGGSGVLVYIVMWIAIPAQTGNYSTYEDMSEKKSPDESAPDPVSSSNSNGALIAGLVLILVGLLFLIDRLFPYSRIFDLWPLILVAFGVLLIKPEILSSAGKVEPASEPEDNSKEVVKP